MHEPERERGLSEPSRFKLPLPPAEGQGGEERLRTLFFEAIEETLDYAAMEAADESRAFRRQLAYAGALIAIGENDRAERQLGLALSSAHGGTSQYNELPEYMESPQFMREHAVSIGGVAAGLHALGETEEAEHMMSEASKQLAEAVEAPNSGDFAMIPDMWRGAREGDCVLELAGFMADMGELEAADEWRRAVPVELGTYKGHLGVLNRMRASAYAAENEDAKRKADIYKEALINETLAAVQREVESDMWEVVNIRDVTALWKTAVADDVEVDIAPILSLYHWRLSQKAAEALPGESVCKHRLPMDGPHEYGYQGLLEAYSYIGNYDEAYNVSVRLMSSLHARVEGGEDDALERIAAAQLFLGREDLAELNMEAVDLRYRLELRLLQAKLALAKRSIDGVDRVLDKAVEELWDRFDQADPPEDEFETSMGMHFARLYGEIGDYRSMAVVYAGLEVHNEEHEDTEWNLLGGENGSKNPDIARYFVSDGKITKALDALGNASAIDQAEFLVGLMEKICSPDPSPEAIVTDPDELAGALENFIGMRYEKRQ